MQPFFTFDALYQARTYYFTLNIFSLMKKVVFAFTFFFALGIAAANAQCHATAAASGKSCCASKMASAMAADPTVEKRMADDGVVSYVRKEADTQGSVRFVSVQFDETNSKFVNVNVAPKTMAAGDKAEFTKKSASCTTSEKKACAGAAGGKACCASKAAAAEVAKPTEQ